MAYPQTSFTDTQVHTSSLVGRRREAVRLNTLLYQLQVLKDTGRYEAFKLGWHPSYDDVPNQWPVPNHLFWDSDIGKWIEGACYFLKQHPNEEVDNAVKELVEMIRGAQQPDGYINIHYTVVEPKKRWSNLTHMHELYNCGHLIEGALAHQDHYKNDRFMEPMLNYVDLLCERFGPGPKQSHGYPGHPEIELALFRLYDRTRNREHLDLAKYFVTERGNPKGEEGRHFYDVEAERRGEGEYTRPQYYPEPRAYWYNQAHKPIAEQETIEGHSVRAMYLLTAAADLVREDSGADHKALTQAIERLWSNMVDQKMYSTGGIGAMTKWEGFGIDYFLPQGTDEGGCYAETCASIGVMMLADRLLRLDLDGRYTDVLELCLYNTVLTSMSHDGKAFTYDNQLGSSDANPSRREEWFTCACCPPNVLRVLGMIGGYIWSHEEREQATEIICHLFIAATLKFEVGGKTVELEQKGDWPWSGDIEFKLKTGVKHVSLKLRIPAWAESYTLSPPCPDAKPHKGYLTLPSTYLAQNPSFTLSIPLKPHLIASHPFTNQNTLTVARGPVVYCAEDVDNEWVEDHFKNISLSPSAKLHEHPVTDSKTGDSFVSLTVTEGVSTIDLDGGVPGLPWMSVQGKAEKQQDGPKDLKLVPYYFRANRGGRGQMRVGMKRGD